MTPTFPFEWNKEVLECKKESRWNKEVLDVECKKENSCMAEVGTLQEYSQCWVVQGSSLQVGN